MPQRSWAAEKREEWGLMGTKECPNCSMNMIQWLTGHSFQKGTEAARYNWQWWCTCGHIGGGGAILPPLPPDERREAWRQVNEPDPR